MAHTPGPWFVNDDCIEAGGPEGPRDVTLAVVQGHPHNACRAANARLIAAAPALLAACKLALTAGDQQYVQFILRDAIAKAEGVTTEGTNGKERSLD